MPKNSSCFTHSNMIHNFIENFLNHRVFIATIKLKCSSQTILASTFKISKSHLSHLKVQIQRKYCKIEFKAITPNNHISYVNKSHQSVTFKQRLKAFNQTIPISIRLPKLSTHSSILYSQHSIIITSQYYTQIKAFSWLYFITHAHQCTNTGLKRPRIHGTLKTSLKTVFQIRFRIFLNHKLWCQ